MTEAEWLTCAEPKQLVDFLGDKLTERKLMLWAVGCCSSLRDLIIDKRSRDALVVAEAYVEGQASRQQLTNAHQQAATAEEQLNQELEAWIEAGEDMPPETVQRTIFNRNLKRVGNDYYLREAQYSAALAAMKCATQVRDELINAVFMAAVAIANEQMFRHYEQAAEVLDPFSDKMLNAVNGFQDEQHQRHCLVLQEIVGNPFCPVNLDSACLSWNDGTVRKIAQSIYDERAYERMPILADALTDAGCDTEDILSHCRSDGPHVRRCWVVDLLLGKE
jgi:hypothetical protein